jgi:SagB-type dehydrogenase family enzyme
MDGAMTRLRHDLNHLTSAGLLVAALATGLTGVVADLWDLNDFWYHTVSGYLMGALAIAHVLFNWRVLWSYARFRLLGRARRPGVPAAPSSAPPPVPARAVAGGGAPRGPGGLRGALLTRRGLLGAGVGAAAGLVVGRGLRQPPPIPHGSDVGVIYHEWSKPGLIDAFGTVASWGPAVPLYKRHDGTPIVPLGEPDLGGGLSASEAIAGRRSRREYDLARPMSRAELSRLLHLAGGITADRFGNARRSAPSSGALYPVELYPVVHNVDGVGRGVYHYAVREHALEQLRAGDFRQRVVDQALAQTFLGECGVVVFLSQILQRMRPKYQDRSYRYGLLEVGHVGENLYLAATAMGLGACGVGAFMDDDINDMLGLDGSEEAAVYLVAVGHVPGARA